MTMRGNNNLGRGLNSQFWFPLKENFSGSYVPFLIFWIFSEALAFLFFASGPSLFLESPPLFIILVQLATSSTVAESFIVFALVHPWSSSFSICSPWSSFTFHAIKTPFSGLELLFLRQTCCKSFLSIPPLSPGLDKLEELEEKEEKEKEPPSCCWSNHPPRLSCLAAKYNWFCFAFIGGEIEVG